MFSLTYIKDLKRVNRERSEEIYDPGASENTNGYERPIPETTRGDPRQLFLF
jgi:hypothetical protein